MNILNEDENSYTVESPTGPRKVAKAGLSPDFMGQFQQAATINPQIQVPEPQPVPSYDEEIAKFKESQASKLSSQADDENERQRQNLQRQIEEKKADLLLNMRAQAGERVTLPQGKAWTSPAILESTIANLEGRLAQIPQKQAPVVSGNGGEVGQMSVGEQPSQVSGPSEMSGPAQVSQPQGLGGMSQYERGLRKEAELAEQAGIQQAAMYDGFQRQMEQQQKDRAAREAEKEKLFNQQMVEMEQQQAELGKMQPRDFWEDKSTGSRIVAGLSVMLGALGGAMDETGTNQGADAIDKAIERDLKMQMMKREAFKEGMEGRKNLYQMRFAQFKDKDLAEAATRSDMLQGIELQIKKMQAGMAGPQAKAKLDQVLGEIKMKRDAANAEIAAKYAEKQFERQDKMAPRFVPALGGFAPSEKAAQDLREMSTTVANTNQSVDELLKILNTSNKSLSPELSAQAQAIKGVLTGSLRTFLVGPGAVTEYEQKLLDSIVANPTKAFQLDSSAKRSLETLKKKVNDGFKNMAKAQGLTPQEQKQIKTTARQ